MIVNLVINIVKGVVNGTQGNKESFMTDRRRDRGPNGQDNFKAQKLGHWIL